MKILSTPRMERCIGCHSCSLACARLVYKQLSWDKTGIRIRSTGGLSTGFEAKPCLACDPAPCAGACPTGAYSQRRSGGVIVKKSLAFVAGPAPGPARLMPFTWTRRVNPSSASTAAAAWDSVPMTVWKWSKFRPGRQPTRAERGWRHDSGPFPSAQG